MSLAEISVLDDQIAATKIKDPALQALENDLNVLEKNGHQSEIFPKIMGKAFEREKAEIAGQLLATPSPSAAHASPSPNLPAP